MTTVASLQIPQARPFIKRTISQALAAIREREESETLLGDSEDDENCTRLPYFAYDTNPYSHLPVYKNIHRIRRLIITSIDDPYPLDQLMGPRLNVAIVRPLVERLYDPDDISIVYCLLVNRLRFLRSQGIRSHHQTVNLTRANLCEILCAKILRRFSEENPSRQGLLLLANILVAGFEPFQNAPEDFVRDHRGLLHSSRRKKKGTERLLTALEVAIITESKTFLASSACQRVVDAVYNGRIVYTPNSFIDLIPDHYKRRIVSLYDPRRRPLLNQYRLIVPRTRNFLEMSQFIILLILYSATMINRDNKADNGVSIWEVAFIIYAAGWVTDEFSSVLEHGWHVHTQNLWSFLDITFVFIYWIYLIVRLHGWTTGRDDIGRQGLDVLACAAPILFPRLAFNVMPQNMLFIALRAMMSNFILLTAVAAWCFLGFLLAMRWLSRWSSPNPDPTDSLTISKWMLWIWFGLDGTGIQRSGEFHAILGPVLMVLFAFLGNTLFLTILVSMLTNTFSKIADDADKEIQFRRTVLTFEGVKSDAIFAYRPPFNLLALMILVPLRFVLSPRWFHKVHITATRILNFPILLGIGLYERKMLWKRRAGGLGTTTLRRSNTNLLDFVTFSAHRDLQDVFDVDPPESMIEEIEEEDVLDDDILDVGFGRNRSVSPNTAPRRRR